MRKAIVVAVLLCATMACNSDRLTGASAQRAVAQGQAQLTTLPDSILIFVDDVRLQTRSALQSVKPETVQRIEVVKGAAAAARFGSEASGGAIFIYTKKTS